MSANDGSGLLGSALAPGRGGPSPFRLIVGGPVGIWQPGLLHGRGGDPWFTNFSFLSFAWGRESSGRGLLSQILDSRSCKCCIESRGKRGRLKGRLREDQGSRRGQLAFNTEDFLPLRRVPARPDALRRGGGGSGLPCLGHGLLRTDRQVGAANIIGAAFLEAGGQWGGGDPWLWITGSG